MKKLLYILLILALCTPVFADRFGNVGHSIQVVDEVGAKVTTISSVNIYAPGTTTNAVIYKGRNKTDVITLPMTTGSTNTTLSNGGFTWFGTSDWSFSITDGTNIATNADHRDRSASEGTLVFPSYLTSISTTTYTDAQSATFGSTDSAQLKYIAGTAFRMTPSSDGVIFQVGVPSGNQFDTVFLVGGGTGGLTIDEGAATLVWTGGTASLNSSGSGITNIGVGSTGAVNIGDTASGVWSIDGTSTGTINADDSIAVTVSAGTISVASTGGDLTIDATDKSVIIRGTEEAADAILLDADGTVGGIELQCGTGDITLDSGDDIFLEADTGTGDVISIINTQGTNASAVIVRTVAAGSIDIDSGDNITIDVADDITVDTADGKIHLIADGSTAGDITLDAEDDIILTTTGKLTITNTEAMTVSGATTLTGAATGTAGIQSAAVTVTATADGLTTGLIPSGTRFVTVTSDTATKVVVLPASVIGNIVTITVPATGCELQTLASTNETINTVDCDGTNELALVAGSVYQLTCTKAITWVATGVSNVGANEDSLTPDTDS